MIDGFLTSGYCSKTVAQIIDLLVIASQRRLKPYGSGLHSY